MRHSWGKQKQYAKLVYGDPRCGGAACDSLTGVAGWLEDSFECQLPLLALEGVLLLRCHLLVCTGEFLLLRARNTTHPQYFRYWYSTATLFGKLWHPAS